MDEIKKIAKNFMSRKFILTFWITGLSVGVPITFKQHQISDNVVMAVLAILGGVGVAYGFINIKDAKPNG